MRFIIALLLLMCPVSALDIARIGTHTVDENFTDTVDYVEYFYGDYANSTKEAIGSYPSELDYIESRSGPLIMSRWAIRYAEDYLMVNVTGTYPGFAIKEGDRYRIDGKGFIDRLCVDYSYSYMSAVDQVFDFYIIVPDSLRIVSVPESKSEDLEHIYYNLSVSYENNVVHRYMQFTVKNATDIFSYCNERDNLDSVLKQGIIAEYPNNPQGNPAWITGILIALVISLAYLVKK